MVRWIKQAWEDVSPMTIANCFHPFADLEDMGGLSELVTQLTPDITAEQYLQDEEGLSTCDLIEEMNDTNWREQLRSAAVDYPATKKVALLDEEDNSASSNQKDVNEGTSIKAIDVALALSRDLQLFLIEKGEEAAAEYQQRVISILQDKK